MPVTIDWVDVSPTEAERAHVERAFAHLHEHAHETIELRRRGAEYEARLVPQGPPRPATLRLRAVDLAELTARIERLLSILVAHAPAPAVCAAVR